MLLHRKDGGFFIKESNFYWSHFLGMLLVFLLGGEIGYMKAKRKLT